MKSYEVSSVSRSKNSPRAQVTVLIGEGRNRRSITCHIRLVGGKWVGRNPDPRAIPFNKLYEQKLAEAKSNLATAEQVLSNIIGKLEGLEDAEPTDDAAITETVAALQVADKRASDAQMLVDDAESKLDIVQRELPLEVEFIGPGLTY